MDCLYRVYYNTISFILLLFKKKSRQGFDFFVAFSIDRDCVFQSSNDSEKKIPMNNSKKKKRWISGKIRKRKNKVRNTRIRESEEKKWEHKKNTRKQK